MMTRRWLRRVFIAGVILFIGIPTLLTIFRFAGVAFHVSRSSEIVLEEFCRAWPPDVANDVVLQRRVLRRAEFWRVALSMPPVPDASAYVIDKMCYEPHHRILMKRAGSTQQVEICFQCSKMRFNSPWIAGIPLIWERTLNSLFTRYGMPERSAEEYSKLRSSSEP